MNNKFKYLIITFVIVIIISLITVTIDLVNTIKLNTETMFINADIMLQTCDMDYVLCDMPIWKHCYHMLHSLDQWYINPKEYDRPLDLNLLKMDAGSYLYDYHKNGFIGSFPGHNTSNDNYLLPNYESVVKYYKRKYRI